MRSWVPTLAIVFLLGACDDEDTGDDGASTTAASTGGATDTDPETGEMECVPEGMSCAIAACCDGLDCAGTVCQVGNSCAEEGQFCATQDCCENLVCNADDSRCAAE